jgi:hypothetical protein
VPVPNGLTQFTLDEIETALRKTGGLQSRAATLLTQTSKDGRHITRQGIARRLGRSARLRTTLEDINEGLKDMAEDQLLKNIKRGRERSVMWYLATKARDRGYGSGGSGVDLDGNFVAGASVHIYMPDNGRDPLIVNGEALRKPNGRGNGLITHNGEDAEGDR